jgi:PAS domain S-box-containing protein
MSGADAHDGYGGVFWAAFSHSSNPMFVIGADRRIAAANTAGQELLGRSAADVVGLAWPSVVTRPGPAVDEATWRAMIVGERDVVGQRVIRRPDGSTVEIDFAARSTRVAGVLLVLGVCLHVAPYAPRAADASDAASATLTNRELEVVRLVALGRTGPQIAAELHVAEDTVRNHVRNAMVKTAARTRAHLVAIAFADGLLAG